MAEYPEDVMKAARKAALTHRTPFNLVKAIVEGREDTMYPVPQIAAAIIAERERCATLIERRGGSIPDRQEIAREIRGGVSA